MSLRARLVGLLFALVVVAVVASNVAAYVALQSFLRDRAEQEATTVALPAAAHYLGIGDTATDAKVQGYLSSLPADVFAMLRDPSGRELVSRAATENGSAVSPPQLPATLPPPNEPLSALGVGAVSATHFEVTSVDGAAAYDIVAVTGSDGRVAFAALSLRGAAETLSQLLRIEVVAALLVLAGVAFAAFIIVRLGLRPLTRIERTAGAIAEGELGRRVSPADSRTEVGRLGLALNAMLERIETAFRAREASEARLRRFVADASHELRTPLAGIRGYAELYRRGARGRPTDLDRVIRGIEDEAERMGRLVDELLLLARLDNGQQLVLEPVDLTRLALEAVDGARVVEPAREISLKGERPVWVIGDEGRLRQALDNLLSNVRVHTPTPTPARVTVRAVGSTAVLEVADEGPGMSAEQCEHAFERFYRGDASRSRDRGGSGLGLSIVSAIVAAHGGQASIESANAGGTRVRLELPTVVGGGHVSGRRVTARHPRAR